MATAPQEVPQIGSRIRSRVEIITPELAEAWLEKNESNRNIVQATVERYARDMATSRWLVTGEAIHFGKSGRLLNGQHRLWACIVAGVPFETLVVRGIENEEEVMDVIDTPMKRTLAHALTIHGEKDSNNLASIINVCWKYQRDRHSSPAYPTHAEGIDWLAENSGAREAVHVARAVYAALRAQLSPVGAAYYLNAIADAEAAEEFWRLAASGEGLPSGSAILAYRRFVIATLSKRDRPNQKVWLAYNLKAMNLWRAGKKVRLLTWKMQDGMPETWGS